MYKPKNLLCLALAVWSIASPSFAQTPGSLPVLESENLNGREVVFPRDLPGSPVLVLIPFSQEEQRTVNEWIEALGLATRDDVRWIEMPAVPRITRLIKRQLDGWMRDGIPRPEDRARVFTVYTNLASLRRAIGVPEDTATAAIVVDANGSVLAAAVGSPSQSTARIILDAARTR